MFWEQGLSQGQCGQLTHQSSPFSATVVHKVDKEIPTLSTLNGTQRHGAGGQPDSRPGPQIPVPPAAPCLCS